MARIIPRVRISFKSGTELNIIDTHHVLCDENSIQIYYDEFNAIYLDHDDLSEFCVDVIRRDEYYELS